MELYTALRTFADSWALLFLTLFFVGVIVWVLRPGSSQAHNESAQIPFRNDDSPATGVSRRSGKEA